MASLFDQFINRVKTLPQQITAIPQLFNPPKSYAPPPPPPKPLLPPKPNSLINTIPKAVNNVVQKVAPPVNQYLKQVEVNKKTPFFNNTGNNPVQWAGKVIQDTKKRGAFEGLQDLTYPILEHPYIEPLTEPLTGAARVANYKAGRPNKLINNLLGQTDRQMQGGNTSLNEQIQSLITAFQKQQKLPLQVEAAKQGAQSIFDKVAPVVKKASGQFWQGVSASPEEAANISSKDPFATQVGKTVTNLSNVTPMGSGAEGLALGGISLIPKAEKLVTGAGQDERFLKAAANIAEHVNPQETTPLFSKLKTGTGNFLGELKKTTIDSFAPIEDTINRIAKEHTLTIPKTEDPRYLYNRVLGAPTIATQVIKQNLEPVLKQVGPKNLDEFDHYLAARHAIDVAGKGIETGIDPEDAKTFVGTLGPKYEQAAQAVTKHTQDILKYVSDNGLISKDLYNHLIEKYPNYVPLQRIMDEVTSTGVPSRSVASVGQQTVVRSLKGSEKDIQSPLNSIIQKTYEAVDQVERNRTASALVNLRNLDGFKDIIKPVIDAAGKNTVSVFEDGSKKFYEVPKDIAETAKGMNAEQLGLLGRILQVPGRVFRATTTSANVPFAASNLIKDQFTALLNSKKALKTANPINFIQSFFDVIGQKGAFKDYLASGGGGANYLAQGKNAYKATLKDLSRSTPSRIAHTVANPKQWFSALEDIISTTEQTTRTQQFRGMADGVKNVNPLAAPTEAALEGVKAGRGNTVDFSRAGTWGKVLNSAFVYLNPAIQGTRVAANAFKSNPIGTSVKTIVALELPTAITTLWNTATPDRKAAYDDIPAWEKNTNFIILPEHPVKDAQGRYTGAIKIPLPQTYNGLTIPIRAAIEHFTSNNPEQAGQALLDTLGNISPVDFSSTSALMSRAVPTALQPPIENYTNTKLFTGGKIIPRAQESLPASAQVGYNTPSTVVKLGEKLNTSPAMINNLIKGYGGAVSQQILNAVDQALSKAGLISTDQIGGESVVDNILKRFTSVTGGALENKDFSSVDKYAQDAKKRLYDQRQSSLSIYNQIQKADNKQAVFDQLVKEGKINDSNADQILEIAKEQIKGITPFDKKILSISPLERAQYIQEQLKAKKTRAEKSAYLDEIATKGWLTEDTINALTGTAHP